MDLDFLNMPLHDVFKNKMQKRETVKNLNNKF